MQKTLDKWNDGDVRVLADEVEIDTYSYPQMGGYCAKSTVVFGRVSDGPSNEPGCFSASVWHDGEWPFGGDRVGRVTGRCEVCQHPYEYETGPSHLHHCAAAQFVDFGILVLEAQTTYQNDRDGTGLMRVDKVWRDRVVARLLALPVKES